MEENKNLNPEQNPETNDPVAEDIANAAQKDLRKPRKPWTQEAREWIVSIAIALLVVFVIRTFLFQIIRVDGESMSTTLHNGERLFVSVLDVKLDGVERGDVVICYYPDRGHTNFVKRVVGVPGDQVYRKNGVTHIVYEVIDADGTVHTVDEMLDERYAMYFQNGSSDDYEPYTLGEDEYFVVGDNRYNSHDSRDWRDNSPLNNVGPITGDMIIGKVRTVIWPVDSIRGVH